MAYDHVMNDKRVDDIERLVHAGRHHEAAALLNQPGYVDEALRERLNWFRLLKGAPRQDLHVFIDALREHGGLLESLKVTEPGRDIVRDIRNDAIVRQDPETLRAIVQALAINRDIGTSMWQERALKRLDDLACNLYAITIDLPDESRRTGMRVIAEALVAAAVAIDGREESVRDACSFIMYWAAAVRDGDLAVEYLLQRGADADYQHDQDERMTTYIRALMYGGDECPKAILRHITPKKLTGLTVRVGGKDLPPKHERLMRERREDVASDAAGHATIRKRAKPQKGL